MADLQ